MYMIKGPHFHELPNCSFVVFFFASFMACRLCVMPRPFPLPLHYRTPIPQGTTAATYQTLTSKLTKHLFAILQNHQTQI